MIKVKPLILLVGCSIAPADKSNSAIALREAEKGARELPVNVEYLWLNKHFLPDGSVQNIQDAIWAARGANGIIFSSPVYFGDCTSLMFDYLHALKIRDIDILKGKVVGFCTAGAKRNGGHETLVEWNAWDVMGLGACVVNDGAPISQFGGVVVAGKHGTAQDDKEGMEVCRYTGRRVAETCLILSEGDIKEKVEIQKWNMVAMRKDYDLGRCWACLDGSSCPDETKEDYKCRNQKDGMKTLHPILMKANGVVPSALDMRMVERTRYLRRDNYRLTYHVVKITHTIYTYLYKGELNLVP